jgi:hypothetical protein
MSTGVFSRDAGVRLTGADCFGIFKKSETGRAGKHPLAALFADRAERVGDAQVSATV